MSGGRLIGRIGRCARVRLAMLVKQARRSARGPLRTENTGQQRIDGKRVRNNAANKAAP